MIDTRRTVETPEGVDLLLTPAGPAARAQAWMVDALINFGILFFSTPIVPLLGPTGMGLYLIVMFIVMWFYPVLFEVLASGRTPGKMALGLRVVHANGTPVGWSASLIRNTLRVADFLPFAYAIGLLSCLLTRDFQRLGDLAAGTLVVHAEPKARVVSLPEAEAAPPPVPLSASEQRAIVDYAERTPALSAERADELAAILRPMTGPAAGKALLGMATWISGRR